MSVIDIANLKALYEAGRRLEDEAQNAAENVYYEGDEDEDDNEEACREAMLAINAAEDELARVKLLANDADIKAATIKLAKAKKAYDKAYAPLAKSYSAWRVAKDAEENAEEIGNVVGTLGQGLRALSDAIEHAEKVNATSVDLTPSEKMEAWEAGLDKLVIAHGFSVGATFPEMLEAVRVAKLDEYIKARKIASHAEVMEILSLGYPLGTYNAGRGYTPHAEIVARTVAGLTTIEAAKD